MVGLASPGNGNSYAAPSGREEVAPAKVQTSREPAFYVVLETSTAKGKVIGRQHLYTIYVDVSSTTEGDRRVIHDTLQDGARVASFGPLGRRGKRWQQATAVIAETGASQLLINGNKNESIAVIGEALKKSGATHAIASSQKDLDNLIALHEGRVLPRGSHEPLKLKGIIALRPMAVPPHLSGLVMTLSPEKVSAPNIAPATAISLNELTFPNFAALGIDRHFGRSPRSSGAIVNPAAIPALAATAIVVAAPGIAPLAAPAANWSSPKAAPNWISLKRPSSAIPADRSINSADKLSSERFSTDKTSGSPKPVSRAVSLAVENSALSSAVASIATPLKPWVSLRAADNTLAPKANPAAASANAAPTANPRDEKRLNESAVSAPVIEELIFVPASRTSLPSDLRLPPIAIERAAAPILGAPISPAAVSAVSVSAVSVSPVSASAGTASVTAAPATLLERVIAPIVRANSAPPAEVVAIAALADIDFSSDLRASVETERQRLANGFTNETAREDRTPSAPSRNPLAAPPAAASLSNSTIFDIGAREVTPRRIVLPRRNASANGAASSSAPAPFSLALAS